MDRRLWILVGLLATAVVVTAFTHRDIAWAQTKYQFPSQPGSANATIVVTWDPNDPDHRPNSPFAVVEAKRGQHVRIKGAGFDADNLVILTVCDRNLMLGQAQTNKCGAFTTVVTIPATAGPGVVSVRAWYPGRETAVLKASWPLDIPTG